MLTPTTATGLAMYDHLEPAAAALAAWREPGPDPMWHRQAQRAVRAKASRLAAALDDDDRELVRSELAYRLPTEVRRAMPLIARAADRTRG